MFPALEWFILHFLEELDMPRRKLLGREYLTLFSALQALENSFATLAVIGASRPEKAVALLASTFSEEFRSEESALYILGGLRTVHAEVEAETLAQPGQLPWRIQLKSVYGALEQGAVGIDKELGWEDFRSERALAGRTWPGIGALYYGLVNPGQMPVWFDGVLTTYDHLRENVETMGSELSPEDKLRGSVGL